MEAIKEDYLARMQRLWCKLRVIVRLSPLTTLDQREQAILNFVK
jgi:hypothetical protein